MGMCKGCSQVFSALEMKDGLCKECIENGVQIEEPKQKKQEQGYFKELGLSLAFIGIAWGAWAFNADTTVTTERQVIGEGDYKIEVPSVTVNNIGLMNQQRNHLMGAGVATIIGVILFAMGGRRKEER